MLFLLVLTLELVGIFL